MKKLMSIMAVVALVSVFAVGCGAKTDSEKSDSKTGSAAQQNDKPKAENVVFKGDTVCGSCGADDLDEGHKCITDDGCHDCKFQHGSALCCTKVDPEAVKGKVICTKCGGLVEGEHTCADDKPCGKCRYQEGSALCCKTAKTPHSH